MSAGRRVQSGIPGAGGRGTGLAAKRLGDRRDVGGFRRDAGTGESLWSDALAVSLKDFRRSVTHHH